MITSVETNGLDPRESPFLDEDQGNGAATAYTQPMGARIAEFERFSAKAWMDQVGRAGGPAARWARAFTLLDGLAAVGFQAESQGQDG